MSEIRLVVILKINPKKNCKCINTDFCKFNCPHWNDCENEGCWVNEDIHDNDTEE